MWRKLVFVGALGITQLVPRLAKADMWTERILVISEYAEPAPIEYYDSTHGWKPVCISPCAALIAPMTKLRTRSKRTTTEFAIAAQPGERVFLPIREAVLRGNNRTKGRVLGIVGIAVGGVTLGLSLFLALAATSDDLRSEDSGEDYVLASAVTFLGGGGLLAGGLVGLFLSRRPSTMYETVTPPPAQAPFTENRNALTAMDRPRREPAPVPASGAITVPLMSVRF